MLDPWASWGVADRTVELEKVLEGRSLQVLVEEGTEGALHRERSGMTGTEAKDLIDEDTDGVLTRARHLVRGRDLSKG